MNKIQVKHILAGLLIYGELLVIGLREHICSWIEEKSCGVALVMTTINDHIWLLVATIIAFALPAFYVICWESQMKKASFIRILIYGTTALMLYYYKNIPLPNGDTMMVGLGSLFIAFAIIELVKYLQNENDKPMDTDARYLFPAIYRRVRCS